METKNWTVSASDRYSGAWSEINTRLALRQNSRLAYVSISWVMLGIAANVIIQDSFLKNDLSIWVQLVMALILTFIPVLSLAFSLWSFYDDSILGLLSAYCKTIENGEQPINGIIPPSWHTPGQNWLSEARKVRKNFDIAFNIMIYMASGTSILLTVIIISDVWLLIVFLFLQLLLLVLTIRVNRKASKKREEIRRSNYVYNWESGKYEKTS